MIMLVCLHRVAVKIRLYLTIFIIYFLQIDTIIADCMVGTIFPIILKKNRTFIERQVYPFHPIPIAKKPSAKSSSKTDEPTHRAILRGVVFFTSTIVPVDLAPSFLLVNYQQSNLLSRRTRH